MSLKVLAHCSNKVVPLDVNMTLRGNFRRLRDEKLKSSKDYEQKNNNIQIDEPSGIKLQKGCIADSQELRNLLNVFC